MAVSSFQHPAPAPAPDSNGSRSRNTLLKFFQSSSSLQDRDVKPGYYELAVYTDLSSYRNEAAVAYCPCHSDYEAWVQGSGFGAFWQDLKPAGEVGWFLEVFSLSIDRFETLFSSDTVPEGAANMRESVSGPVREHVCWGSMRDRLAIPQTDALEGEHLPGASKRGELTDTKSRRIRVAGRKNLCVIRSGQDWSGTNPRERKLYLETMHPVLVKGIGFLTGQGSDVGRLSNRFMDVVDHANPTRLTDKTFGLGYFDSIASLGGVEQAA